MIRPLRPSPVSRPAPDSQPRSTASGASGRRRDVGTVVHVELLGAARPVETPGLVAGCGRACLAPRLGLKASTGTNTSLDPERVPASTERLGRFGREEIWRVDGPSAPRVETTARTQHSNSRPLEPSALDSATRWPGTRLDQGLDDRPSKSTSSPRSAALRRVPARPSRPTADGVSKSLGRGDAVQPATPNGSGATAFGINALNT